MKTEQLSSLVLSCVAGVLMTINFWLGLVLLICAFYDARGLLFE